MVNKNTIGKTTELEVLLYITKLGYSVSIPFGDKDRYDQIWDINGKLLKIQVKTSKSVDKECSGIQFSCRSISNGKAHKYNKDEIDYFATYWNNRVYMIPVEECSNIKKLRFLLPKNKQNSQINWADNYLFEEMIKNI